MDPDELSASTESKQHGRTILVPLDGSPHANRALDWYQNNLRRVDDHVIVVNCVEPLNTTPLIEMTKNRPPPYPDMERVVGQMVHEAKCMCRTYRQRLRDSGVRADAFVLHDAKPGPSLVKSIIKHKADMVVMGNRGIGTLRRTFLGSVSDYILHHSHVPVVIVPPPEPK